jgi:hypothetical protein
MRFGPTEIKSREILEKSIKNLLFNDTIASSAKKATEMAFKDSIY